MKQTYKNFLKEYVTKLTNSDTLYLKKLLYDAEYSNPRLSEVLILYMISNYSNEKIQKNLPKYHKIYDLYKKNERFILNDSYINKKKPYEFYKIYQSFIVKKEYINNNEELKQYILKEILETKIQKEISNYRIYSDLKLNPGNINSLIKNHDTRKISKEVLIKIKEYVDNY